MTLLIVALCVLLSVGSLVMFVVQVAPSRPADVSRRLAEVRQGSGLEYDAINRRRRQAQAERLKHMLEGLGQRMEGRRRDNAAVRERLIHAGFTAPSAVAIYWAVRLTLALGLPAAVVLLLPLVGASGRMVFFVALYFGLVGWIAPAFFVGGRRKRRQHEIQVVMPDALDLLVICVEAGLGLNQALVRVAQEMAHMSQLLSDQLTLVNLEIRAGTPREDALRNLGERTGVPDMRSLVAMLIQTDRFGTSVAQALRIQADTLRTIRRQRAEEAAAKTTIKMLFPLAICIFPAMFVVILGPAIIQIIRTFDSL